MITKKIFGFVLAITILLSCCSAKIYKVGGSRGWSGKTNSWAERKEFHVGDSLIFQYHQNVNDVTQLSDALKYESCNSSSPKAVYNTGHDVVTLKEPGIHYFISSNHIQCVNGLELDIYRVGDYGGWSVYNSYYYYKWSEGKQFHVEDTLFFQYNKELNDVREITDELEFRSCESTSTVAVYKTGHDLIKLTKPGVHYFVSLKTGLCQAGIKLRVTVQPSTEAVTFPNVPKKKLSPIVNRW
ncbi:unnamed protein product [Arabidopsis thaliana]|uniref:(thale cress) hypothetical protein n=1 Tax=Arabidopsis thaliana TaxID=3702 RepID=A0A7G2EQV7_ARATH|nr:unnamed protein product [Arabidopsis thaliana]